MKRLCAILVCLGLSSPLVAQEAPGIITTFAGGGRDSISPSIQVPAINVRLFSPVSISVDVVRGNVYIDHYFRVGTDGLIIRFAGGGVAPRIRDRSYVDRLGDGGLATSALLYYGSLNTVNLPVGIAVEPRGNIYIADTGNHRIRRVDLNGIIATLAGRGDGFAGIEGGFSGDGGYAAQAELNTPTDVAMDPYGNLYVADLMNDRIRRISPDGVITTFAGTGRRDLSQSRDGWPADQAALISPMSVAVDTRGNVYIAEYYANRVRWIASHDYIIRPFAGTGEEGFSGDGGPATQARLTLPTGVAVDGAGNVYIADLGNRRIRRVDPDGIITTFAGTGVPNFSGDGGPATQAALDHPTDVAVDARGYVYIADTRNDRIRRVSPLKPLETPLIDVSAPSMLFDVTEIGSTSEQTFTISNTGKAPASVTGIFLEGADAVEFQVSPRVATLPPGGSLAVKVTFVPRLPGLKFAAIRVVHDAVGSPWIIRLTAKGPSRSRDFNGDGKVDLEDFFLFAAAFGKPITGETVKFDLDGNGRINFDDFFLFAERFGR